MSESGLLVFQSRRDFSPQLIWTDPTGNRSGQIIGEHWEPCISPDGRYVALSSNELQMASGSCTFTTSCEESHLV